MKECNRTKSDFQGSFIYVPMLWCIVETRLGLMFHVTSQIAFYLYNFIDGKIIPNDFEGGVSAAIMNHCSPENESFLHSL